MPTTLYHQRTIEGDLLLAGAATVDAVRADLHRRATIGSYEEALTAGDMFDHGLLDEVYIESASSHVEFDPALLPDDPALWPAPHRSWDLTALLRQQQAEHPPSFLADLWYDLPGDVRGDLRGFAEVRGSFMAPDEPLFPAAVADEVLRRLTTAGVALLDDGGLDTPIACFEGWCSCTSTSDTSGRRRAVERDADAVLPTLWIGDGQHVPHGRFDTVVTVAPRLGDAVAPASHVTHVEKPYEDSQFQPIDPAPFTAAVAATVDALQRGDTILVRCQAGINRSSLVVGEALARLGWPRPALVDLIRNRRPGALTNPFFADVLRGVVGPDMRPAGDGGAR